MADQPPTDAAPNTTEQPAVTASAETDDHIIPVKALLSLYERGNQTNFSSHTILEEEVRILRGFVRSKKSIFEQLSTQPSSTNLMPKAEGARTIRKWERSKTAEPQPQPQPVGTQSPKGARKTMGATQVTEKDAVPAIAPEVKPSEAPKPEHAIQSETQPEAKEEAPMPEIHLFNPEQQEDGEGSKKAPSKPTPMRLDMDDDTGNVIRPRFSFIGDDMVQPSPSSFAPPSVEFVEAIEKMKLEANSGENKEVSRLQRRLTKALASHNQTSHSKLQALILDALEREEDEERPVIRAVRATGNYNTPVSEEPNSMDMPFTTGELFGVIQELDSVLKVRDTDGQVRLIPADLVEEASRDDLTLFQASPPPPRGVVGWGGRDNNNNTHNKKPTNKKKQQKKKKKKKKLTGGTCTSFSDRRGIL